MSKNIEAPTLKSNSSKKAIWFLVALCIVVLDAIAVLVALFLTESKINEKIGSISTLENKVSYIEKETHKTPQIIANLNSHINQNAGNINLLTEKFNNLNNEVGHNKFEVLSLRVNSYVNRLEELEETKNKEALVLSIALLIKENALYGRNFETEVNALKEIAYEQTELNNDIEAIQGLKDRIIPTDDTLLAQYHSIIDNFDFEKKETNNTNEQNQNMVSKSINKIKETVASINFDKVVIVKKDSKTEEQKQLIKDLTSLINQHMFSKAFDFVQKHPQFANAQDIDFDNWLRDVELRVMFDKAVSNIISNQLKAIRNNLYNNSDNIDTSRNNEDLAND